MTSYNKYKYHHRFKTLQYIGRVKEIYLDNTYIWNENANSIVKKTVDGNQIVLKFNANDVLNRNVRKNDLVVFNIGINDHNHLIAYKIKKYYPNLYNKEPLLGQIKVSATKNNTHGYIYYQQQNKMLSYKYENDLFLVDQYVIFHCINGTNFNNQCKCELVDNMYPTKIISLNDINSNYLDELGNNKCYSKYYIKGKKLDVEENINYEFKLYRFFLFSI